MIVVKKEAIKKESIEPYFEQWLILSDKIHKAHNERNGEAYNLMVEGIELFEQLILSTSEVNNKTMNQMEQYEVLPINGMERYLFIKAKPAQYACYRQLDELFKETKKRLARLRVK